MNSSFITGCGLNNRQSGCVAQHFSSASWRCGEGDPHKILSQNGALIASSIFAILPAFLCVVSAGAKAIERKYLICNNIKDERCFRVVILTCGIIFSTIMSITAFTAGGSCPGWITDDWSRIVNYCRNKYPINADITSNSSICCFGKIIVEHQEVAKTDKIGPIVLTLVSTIAIGILLIDACRDYNKISDEEAQSLVVQTNLSVTEIDSSIGFKIKRFAMPSLAMLAFGCTLATLITSKSDCPDWVLNSWESCQNS